MPLNVALRNWSRSPGWILAVSPSLPGWMVPTRVPQQPQIDITVESGVAQLGGEVRRRLHLYLLVGRLVSDRLVADRSLGGLGPVKDPRGESQGGREAAGYQYISTFHHRTPSDLVLGKRGRLSLAP